MSIRQRIPFKFSNDSQDERRILDEQEQEELIQKLKDESESRNIQNIYALQAVLALSSLLHLIYFINPSGEPPLSAIFSYHVPPSFEPIQARHIFTLLHLFIHANLSIHLLPPRSHFRRSLSRLHSTPWTLLIPLPFYVLFVLSAFAPVLSLSTSKGWVDVLWWSETAFIVVFVQRAQTWIQDETEDIRGLEGLRYDAKGA